MHPSTVERHLRKRATELGSGNSAAVGAGAIAARKFPVLAGLARQNQTTLFVSRGVGTVYVPIRLNCPPEVVLLTLRSENLPRHV